MRGLVRGMEQDKGAMLRIQAQRCPNVCQHSPAYSQATGKLELFDALFLLGREQRVIEVNPHDARTRPIKARCPCSSRPHFTPGVALAFGM